MFVVIKEKIMGNYKKEYWNKPKTKCVIITRTKLSDGYNYYLMVIKKGMYGKMVVDDSLKQKEILSEKDAITTAKKLL